MKVIDLLNKIANGEEVPLKIRVYNDIYEYDTFNKSYWNKQHKNLLELYNGYILNYEVEIIEDTPEENNKIEKLDLDELNNLLRADLSYDNLFYRTHKMLVETKSKINEIIDKINGGNCEN